jgi:tetratricopeptide (TPR) repeat protein
MKLLSNRPVQKPVSQSEMPLPSSQRKRRPRRVVLIVLAALALILLGAGGGYLLFRPRVQPLSLPALPANLTAADLGLTGWQDYQLPLPAHPLADPHLPGAPQVNPSLALLEDAAGQALIQQGQLNRGLAYLRAAAQSDVENLRYSNDYRLALRDHKLYSDEFTYFSQLAKQNTSPNVLISFALTYVDQMRSCPTPPDGLVCQAQDSWNSINVLNGVIDKHPYNVIARFARGLNHLYWPSLMGHLPLAQIDLQYAVALTRPLASISRAFIPQAYAALGDVFAKDGKVEQARNVWLNGEAVVPNSSLLSSRLTIPQDQLVNAENGSLRGLGVYVDTDLATFWRIGG